MRPVTLSVTVPLPLSVKLLAKAGAASNNSAATARKYALFITFLLRISVVMSKNFLILKSLNQQIIKSQIINHCP
jgi:hypothetical protein